MIINFLIIIQDNMGNSYLDVLERIANALEQQNGIPIWEILINIIPWIGVIIPIVVLFM